MDFIKDFQLTTEIIGSEHFDVLIIYYLNGTTQKFYLFPQ